MSIRRQIARLIEPNHDDELNRARGARRRAEEERDTALRRLDDLAIRILEATLAIGRVGRVKLSRDYTGGDRLVGYTAESVDRLLETARDALYRAEDVARYATATRRDVRHKLPHDPELAAHDLLGTLRRIRDVISVPTGPPWDTQELIAALFHAFELAEGAISPRETSPTP